MENLEYLDIFATKGIEYLAVIIFLIILALFWKLLNRPVVKIAASELGKVLKLSLIDWFYVAEDFYYHQGHSWVAFESSNVVRIGIDDFAQKLLGKPSYIKLPKVGSKIVQGIKGMQFLFDGKSIGLISPVDGDIIEINQGVLNNPELINEDPYHEGWLMKVRINRLNKNLTNLLSGQLAKDWMQQIVNRVSNRLTGKLGIVLQDGGIPVRGFAKEIAPDTWDQLAKEFLLTDHQRVKYSPVFQKSYE